MEVVPSGEAGEKECDPHRGGGDVVCGIDEPAQALHDGIRIALRLQADPQQCGDDEDHLENGFEFSPTISGHHDSAFDGDLAQTGDEEFASDDQDRDPHRAEVLHREMDEGSADEDFIHEWIEQFAEGGDEIEFARKVAIEPVRGGGDDECREGDPCGGDACNRCGHHIDDREEKSGEGDRVW